LPTWIGLLVGIAYYFGAMVGFALTLPNHSVSTLWPPNSIMLAFLLLQPRQRYWIILLGAFPAHLAIQLQSGVPLPLILCWFISNCSEALIGAICLRRYIVGPVNFSSVRCVLLYVVFAVLLAPFVSSFLDAGFVSLLGWKPQSYWEVWLTRFPSNVLAEMAIPPVILLGAFKGIEWFRGMDWRHHLEAFFVMGGLIVVSLFVFGSHNAGIRTPPAFLYLPLPFLLWAAMRFGAAGASSALLIVVLGSIFGATSGGGPFISASPAENVFSLQMFLMAISLPIVFLAGLVEEQREKAKMLSDSEARFRSMANTAPALIWMSGTDKRFTFFNKAWLDLTGAHSIRNSTTAGSQGFTRRTRTASWNSTIEYSTHAKIFPWNTVCAGMTVNIAGFSTPPYRASNRTVLFSAISVLRSMSRNAERQRETCAISANSWRV
jgi:integral membrane sensor domain MASE1